MVKKDTFLITEGKIKTGIREISENLAFAVEEGYSDQDIMNWIDSVEVEGRYLRKKLNKVI
jgi:hypothetical protein